MNLLVVIVPTLIGIIVSWFISHLYYKKGIKAGNKENRELKNNLARLMLHSKVPSREVPIEGALYYSQDGELRWNFCFVCGSSQVYRRISTEDSFQEFYKRESLFSTKWIQRSFGEEVRYAEIKVTCQNSFEYFCIDCSLRMWFILCSFAQTVPEEEFAVFAEPPDEWPSCKL